MFSFPRNYPGALFMTLHDFWNEVLSLDQGIRFFRLHTTHTVFNHTTWQLWQVWHNNDFLPYEKEKNTVNGYMASSDRTNMLVYFSLSLSLFFFRATRASNLFIQQSCSTQTTAPWINVTRWHTRRNTGMIYELCSRSSVKCVMYGVFSTHPAPAQPQTMRNAHHSNAEFRTLTGQKVSIRFLCR